MSFPSPPDDQPAARSRGAAAKGEPISLLPWERSRHNITCTSPIYSTPLSITSMNLLPVMIEPTWEYQENSVQPVASTASNYLAPSTSTYSHHYIVLSCAGQQCIVRCVPYDCADGAIIDCLTRWDQSNKVSIGSPFGFKIKQ